MAGIRVAIAAVAVITGVGVGSAQTVLNGWGDQTTGVVDGQPFSGSTDRFGTTTGQWGDKPVQLHSDKSGTTTGTIGGQPVICQTDKFGTTICF